MATASRKRRTREHVLEDLSINHVERHVFRCGWTVERMTHDYGIDLELFTFSKRGEVQEGVILLQLKARKHLPFRAGAATFPFRIDRRDLVYWIAQPLPVILVLYDANRDRAFWVYVQSYFHEKGSFNVFAAKATITVQVPTANIVSPASIRRFARFRDRVLDQIREVVHEE